MLGACSLGQNGSLQPKIKVNFEEQLNKQLIRKIIKIKHLFEPYVSFSIQVNVVLLKNHRSAFYLSDINRIMIPVKNFLNPEFKRQGVMGLFHELGHGFVFTLLRHKNLFVKKLIKKAYVDLVERAGFDVFKSRLDYNKTTESNPYFSIFDESSYIFGYPSELGHPYSSVGELFASTLTVIRFFPQEFSKRFKTMSLKEQLAVKDVFDTLIWAILFVNPSEDDLNELLPEHRSIKEVIEKYASQIYS